MSFRTLFVPALSETALEGAFEDAVTFASGGEGGSHIFVHHVRQRFEAPPNMVEAWSMEPMMTQHTEATNALAAELKGRFDDLSAGSHLSEQGVRASWTEADGDMPRSGAKAARIGEVTVVRHMGSKTAPSATQFLEELLFHSGRPLLFTPETGLPRAPRKLAIGWNGSKEAARAVALCMPAIRAAGSVVLLSAGTDERERPPAEWMAESLSFSGIDAEVKRMPAEKKEPADALVAAAKDQGADILVVGAYSRSRLREVILGGVTREILSSPAMPVLISH
jgi:nucleotide-binding universal stress UspA family protein